jgi:hypothetical protein
VGSVNHNSGAVFFSKLNNVREICYIYPHADNTVRNYKLPAVLGYGLQTVSALQSLCLDLTSLAEAQCAVIDAGDGLSLSLDHVVDLADYGAYYS